jgi:hypothetical protein
MQASKPAMVTIAELKPGHQLLTVSCGCKTFTCSIHILNIISFSFSFRFFPVRISYSVIN